MGACSPVEALKVSAADLARHFGDWQTKAASHPIIVTRHGRSTHVLLSYEHFVAAPHTGVAQDALDQSRAELFDLSKSALFILDDQMVLLAANRAAGAFIRQPAGTLVGRPFATILPDQGNDLIHRYLRRTAATGEALSADARISGSERWVSFQTCRVRVGVALMLRDTTDDVTARHVADVKQSMIDAIERDGTVGHARISVREMVEHANGALVAMLGTSEEAFRRVRFSTAIPAAHRGAFVEALERCFAGAGPQALDSQLMTHDGTQLAVRISLVELRGDCAAEGALVLVTRRAA